MTEIYFVTSPNKDLISIMGGFVVLCISSYLLIDAIRDEMRNASLEELVEQQKKLTEYQNKLSSDQKKHLKILVQYNKQFSDIVVHNVVEKTNEIVESLNKVIDSESTK